MMSNQCPASHHMRPWVASGTSLQQQITANHHGYNGPPCMMPGTRAIVKSTWCMMISCYGNAFCITGLLWGESTGDRWISLTKSQWWCRASVSFEMLSKQSSCQWFLMACHSWDVIVMWFLMAWCLLIFMASAMNYECWHPSGRL